jgi:HEAT repeat protein
MRCALLFIFAFTSVASAQTTQPGDGKLDFGDEGLVFPQPTIVNAHVPRTAQLLGEAYRKKDPLEARRVQLIADLGRTAQPAAAPYVIEAMKDDSPAVRAEAARSAAMIGASPELHLALEKLLADADAGVRREAVMSASNLARGQHGNTPAIERGLADRDAGVIAAAIQQAWTPEHAKLVAQKLGSLPKPLRADAATALGRIAASPLAEAVLPLLEGDVVERAAATRALGDMGNAAQSQAVLKMLADAHPTVRREAVFAMAKLADAPTRVASAIRMLRDVDPTVREGAATVLTPMPSAEALAALVPQLDVDYAPLHAAARASLTHPADDAMRSATVRAAVELLAHRDPRRREDASYVLGRLRSGEGFDRHIQLLQWDLAASEKTDWPLVAQVAESLGLIGDPRAAQQLLMLAKAAHTQLERVPVERQMQIGRAMGNALVACGRLKHQPAFDEAVGDLKGDTNQVPPPVRAAAAFVVGALGESGSVPDGVNFLEIYASPDETAESKFEALKALGNLRHAGSASALKTISETSLVPEFRWIAHWSYQRAANVTVPYVPATDRREPPVMISDLPR